MALTGCGHQPADGILTGCGLGAAVDTDVRSSCSGYIDTKRVQAGSLDSPQWLFIVVQARVRAGSPVCMPYYNDANNVRPGSPQTSPS